MTRVLCGHPSRDVPAGPVRPWEGFDMTQSRRRPGRRAWSTAALLAGAAALAAGAVAVAGLGGPQAHAAITGNLKVNMVAYAPNTAKQATVVNSATSPVRWSLRNSGGQEVAS